MTGMDWSNLDQALAHQRSLLKEAENSQLASLGLRAAREARANRFRSRRRGVRELRAELPTEGVAARVVRAHGESRVRGFPGEKMARWRVMVRQIGRALVNVGQRLEAVGR